MMYTQENMYQLHYIKYGLDNISEDSKVTIVKNTITGKTNQLLFTNFQT